MTGNNFWLYDGEPTDEEIQARKQWDSENFDHLAVRATCPFCGDIEAVWVRRQFYVCFNCDSSFTTNDRMTEDDLFWRNFE